MKTNLLSLQIKYEIPEDILSDYDIIIKNYLKNPNRLKLFQIYQFKVNGITYMGQFFGITDNNRQMFLMGWKYTDKIFYITNTITFSEEITNFICLNDIEAVEYDNYTKLRYS